MEGKPHTTTSAALARHRQVLGLRCFRGCCLCCCLPLLFLGRLFTCAGQRCRAAKAGGNTVRLFICVMKALLYLGNDLEFLRGLMMR